MEWFRGGTALAKGGATRVWHGVRSCDGSEGCGDVVSTQTLPDGRLAMVILDLMGHGERRARRAGQLGEQVLGLLALGGRPSTAVALVDLILRKSGWGGEIPTLATIFAGVVDVRQSTLTYASAAHEAAMVLAPGRPPTQVSPTGPIAGVFDDENFEERVVPLREGETLVLTSDGVVESRARSGEHFGIERTIASVASALRRGEDPVRRLIADALLHRDDRNADDSSALVVHRAASRRPATVCA